MARINVEDTLWSDPRFMKLCVRMGDEEKALGRVVVAWRFAQKFWCPDRKPIPCEAWAAASLGRELIDLGLAEEVEGGIRMRGSEDQFDWWFQRHEAGKAGGKKSAQRPRNAKGQLQAGSKRRPSGVQATPNQNQASSSSSSSSSSSVSNSISEIYSVGQGTEAPAEIKNPVGYFIGTYVRAFQARYGAEARPDLTGRVQGKVKRYLSETPLERACAMISAYCSMQDPWFLTKTHDFGTFIENLSKVGVKLDTGQAMTAGQVRQVDRRQTNFNAFAGLLAEAEAKEREAGNG